MPSLSVSHSHVTISDFCIVFRANSATKSRSQVVGLDFCFGDCFLLLFLKCESMIARKVQMSGGLRKFSDHFRICDLSLLHTNCLTFLACFSFLEDFFLMTFSSFSFDPPSIAHSDNRMTETFLEKGSENVAKKMLLNKQITK